ncbi:hypothetical protein [Jiella sp. M17.18]|uniref:hypothetical protein n=1 Tax=Jiella sp. M17.18 TaxID=3234247 RepID=UPI0034DE46BB
MTDPQPRIFRTLEKETGRDRFDTIVSAAVAAFTALRRPSQKHQDEFARLVIPLWQKIGPDTKRALAASLAAAPAVPREVVAKLLAEPVDICAPYLLANAGGQVGARAPVPPAKAPHRQSPPEAVAAPERRKGFQNASHDLLGRGPVPAEPAGAAGDRAAGTVGPGSADEARSTLRRLVSAGVAPRAEAGRSRTPATIGEILAAARCGEAASAYAGIAAMLGRGDELAAELAADHKGETLAMALKALDAGASDALTVVILLKPRVGLNMNAFDELKGFFRDVSRADCRGRFGLSASPDRRTAAPPLQPQTVDLDRRIPAGTARAAFGRRRATPQRIATPKAG